MAAKADPMNMNISYNRMSHAVYELERAGWEEMITAQGRAGHHSVGGEQLYGASLVFLEFYSPLSLSLIFITITINYYYY